ncbi:uncharacterized protein L969DRAFT_88159 [Mixia osmundae IAM 14324]|uniref:Peptidase S8/S53 domain-containing protein n=1 Tax=Mixia osmundae (strain CBS 9802 / IAM 14324 / JCM 22182 / KY 12970) TaxID=764103 RepID=G7E122_MIXOS|nr:uncharacterized protein L969DRAFT_88159 [Mixia osmundae IAM 14324]KEI38832.1 hypothetical protein L969DRAFT_88159 [Mixia osmundae IAM 14324]GAA96532.1 hypothetical protein E5Q_03200 [Mixia osmundae IAM 14324]
MMLLQRLTAAVLTFTAIVNAATIPTGTPYRANGYIVTLSSTSPLAAFITQLEKIIALLPNSGKITAQYDPSILNGFSGQFSGSVLNFIASSPAVASIEIDGIARTSAITQRNADWALSRLGQKAKLAQQNDALTNFSYTYNASSTSMATPWIWIIDTGVRTTDTDFGGRAKFVTQYGGYNLTDGNGHGTHCAGTAAGTQWGVAKSAQIRAIKVLSDSGSGAISDIISGISYVAQQYKASKANPYVINLSIQASVSTALNNAITQAIIAGVHVVVAAGNSAADACQYSPASATYAITVAATDITDSQTYYSNYGKCVDLFAPGTDVTSTWYTSDNSTQVLSGTSMATPHVAGMVAYLLQQPGRNVSVVAMPTLLKSLSTAGAVQGISPNTTNILLRNGSPS